MSWIFGIIGEINNIKLQTIERLHGNPIFTHKTPNLYIAAGGIRETCFHGVENNSINNGWVVSGVGIEYRDNRFHLMTETDWANFFERFSPKRLRELNGHFVIVKWKDEHIECFTDQLGLRNLYLTNFNNKYTCFSTRLDWLAQVNPESNIDYKVFATQWLLINNLSLECPVTHIKRLSQNGYAKCNSESIKFSNSSWSSDIPSHLSDIDYIDLLRELTVFPLRESQKISLALSGGIGSRVLFSILLSSSFRNWSTHSLHDSENADSIISKRLTETTNVDNKLFEDSIPGEDELLTKLNEFVGYTNAVYPISDVLGIEYYTKLHQQNKIVIDGGLGEIARRRYLNRLLLLGKKTFHQREIEKIKSSLFFERAPIFNSDAMKLMHEGINQQLNNLLESMPSVNEFGFENWLDLMAIRTRFPNVAGYEQSRADGYIVTYMPFAQPSFLKKLFEIEISKRKNSKFFKRIIARNNNLTKIPFVKDDIEYPYFLNTILSSIYIKTKKKFRRKNNNKLKKSLLLSLRDFVFDTINSSDFKSDEFHDRKYIKSIISNYDNGQREYINKIIWFITFELWRQNINSKISIFK